LSTFIGGSFAVDGNWRRLQLYPVPEVQGKLFCSQRFLAPMLYYVRIAGQKAFIIANARVLMYFIFAPGEIE
jgi:hypothetical protein